MGQARATEAFFYKTVAKHQEGDLRAAEKGYRKILRHAPKNVATLINLGILLKERDELKKAFELFTQAVSLAPEHADGHANLGALYARLGKKYEAISCYRTALDLDPDLLLSRILLARLAVNIPNSSLRRVALAH